VMRCAARCKHAVATTLWNNTLRAEDYSIV
jgi:hypothetical protein